PDSDQRAGEVGVPEQGDGGAEWAPDSLPGVIVFTAASDGTAALENFGRGVFTDAVLEVLGQTGTQPLTYAQAARQIPPLVSARSYQIPYFQGELAGPILGNVSRKQPIGWEVIALEPVLKLGGPPPPGLGKNAELRIYDGAVTGAETRDPSKAKATVVIEQMSGLNATANVIAARPKAPKITPGDLAIPVRVADADLRVTVRLKPAAKPAPGGGAQALRTAVDREVQARLSRTR
ncbi:MAG: caspase family protein, partial [Gammaproteobacteria bacterium]